MILGAMDAGELLVIYVWSLQCWTVIKEKKETQKRSEGNVTVMSFDCECSGNNNYLLILIVIACVLIYLFLSPHPHPASLSLSLSLSLSPLSPLPSLPVVTLMVPSSFRTIHAQTEILLLWCVYQYGVPLAGRSTSVLVVAIVLVRITYTYR